MGAADVVPGVSGGTIAFITGIYEELIESINRINLEALNKLRKEGIASAWNYINGWFFVDENFLQSKTGQHTTGRRIQGITFFENELTFFTL